VELSALKQTIIWGEWLSREQIWEILDRTPGVHITQGKSTEMSQVVAFPSVNATDSPYPGRALFSGVSAKA